jgi:hypothetical protein
LAGLRVLAAEDCFAAIAPPKEKRMALADNRGRLPCEQQSTLKSDDPQQLSFGTPVAHPWNLYNSA